MVCNNLLKFLQNANCIVNKITKSETIYSVSTPCISHCCCRMTSPKAKINQSKSLNFNYSRGKQTSVIFTWW